MELDDLKNSWDEYGKKLDGNIELNRRILQNMHLGQTRSEMRPLLIFRAIEALIFFMLVVALGSYIGTHLTVSAPTLSAAVLNIFSLLGLIGSIGQIVLIATVDYSGTVISIQQQLSKIRTHSIQILRLILLSVPFYMSYIFLGFEVLFDIDLYAVTDSKWLVTQIIFSFVLIGPTLWLYRELGLNKSSHSWIQRFFRFAGEGQIAKALKILEDIEDLKA